MPEVEIILCEEITGNKIKILPSPSNRTGDIKIYITDNTLITKKTGWTPQKSSKDILYDIFGWIKKYEKLLIF